MKEDNSLKIKMVSCNALLSDTVMLISPPTQREVDEAGGDMTKAIIKHNKVAVMNHLSLSSAD